MNFNNYVCEGQINIFDFPQQKQEQRKRISLISLFSGIGAFEKGLDRLGEDYELIAYCEIDKYASRSYSAIHDVPESMNLGDITKVDATALPKDISLLTYGFPCQDISLAGRQKGLFNEDGTQTRSGLFFEALRIIEATQPRVAIAENVKNLTGKKFKDQFKIVLDSLESAGYNNYWQVLNAKDYGIPQNRERVFIVSIRKDIDTGCFRFPDGFPLELRLKDVLEDEVDEKFYLKSTKNFFVKNSFDMEAAGNGFRFAPHVKKNAEVAKTVTTRAGGRMDDNFVVDIESEQKTFKFDSTNPQLEREAVENFIVGGMQKHQAIKTDGICTCLTSSMGTGCGDVPMHNYTNDLRIRKLTPKECFRLMGFDDADFEKASAVNSNTQLYKQAGNSIVVAVAYYIEKALIEVGVL